MLRVKFCETYKDAEPDRIPIVMETLSLSIYDDTHKIWFIVEDKTCYESENPVESEWEQTSLINSALERGYVDLTKYGYFINKDSAEGEDKDEDEEEEDDDDEA